MMLEYERLQLARRVRDLVDATHTATYAKLAEAEREASKLRQSLWYAQFPQLADVARLEDLDRKIKLYREIHLAQGEVKFASRPSGRNGALMVDRYKEAEETALAEFVLAAENECRRVYRRCADLEGCNA